MTWLLILKIIIGVALFYAVCRLIGGAVGRFLVFVTKPGEPPKS